MSPLLHSVRLPPPANGGPARTVQMAELRGSDEFGVLGVDTAAAASLLQSLVYVQSGVAVAAMPACERDALLAALHRQCWGDRIVSTLTCVACGVRFDLAFQLSELQRYLAAQCRPSDEAPVPPSARREIEAGNLLRAGRRDEALAWLAGDSLARLAGDSAVRLAGNSLAAAGALADALERSAPIIDIDLEAACSECGHSQLARFDLQGFVLQRLLDERDQLLQEIHSLASGYGWPLAEILALPRSARRRLVAMQPVPRAQAEAVRFWSV